jgi:hypothetical protein
MADLASQRNWIVDPNQEVKDMWVKCEIQQRKSQIIRLKQDIDDLKNGQILKLEATIIMLEKEVTKLQSQLVIDITVEQEK